jgi:O-antigen/teichoic acid export membrane protein
MQLLKTVAGRLNNRHFLSLSSNVMTLLLNVSSIALTTRLLNIEKFGEWQYFLYVLATTEATRTYVVQTGLFKYLGTSTAGREAQQWVGSAWAILLGITGVILLLSVPAWLLSTHLQHQTWQFVVKWLGLTLLVGLPYNYATWLLQVNQHFQSIMFLRTLAVGLFVGFVAGLAFIGNTSPEQVVGAYILSQLLTSLASILRGWAQLGSMALARWETCKRLLDFGKYSVWTGVGSTLLKNSDVFIIEATLGTAAVGIYSLPQKAIEIMEVPLRSLLGTAIPTMSAHANQGQMKEVARAMIKFGGFLTVVMLPVVLAGIALADVYVFLIGGADFMKTNAAHVTRVFILFAFMFPIDRFLGITLDLIGRPALNMYKVMIMLAVNVVGDIVAIYLFNDVLAVAAVSILTFLVGILAGHLLLAPHLPYRFMDFFTIGYAEFRGFWNNFLLLIRPNKTT